MHPRLKVLMRPVDLLFFVAEHDDHHLATIVKLSISNERDSHSETLTYKLVRLKLTFTNFSIFRHHKQNPNK
ncbi:MAG: hypothetical protein ACI9M9_001964 [Flavobacteriaceae bacterium]|jgi:hypothetical protein